MLRVFRGRPVTPIRVDGSSAPAAARSISKARLAIAALAAAALLVLLVSQLAQGKDVIGWFGNASGSGSAGGEFSSQSPRDIGVNRSGAGPANQSDIYIADYNNHRIQRFDSERNFISAWGADVVSEGGTGDVDTRSFEICTVASECKAGKGEGDNAMVATNEHKKITFNQAGPSFAAGDTFKLGNLPASCSATETETIEYTGSAASVRENILNAWEAQCGAGGISAFSGPANPQFDFFAQWAEINIPTLSCTTISGGGVCADIDDTDGGPAGPASLPGNGVLNHPESVAVDNDTGNVYVSDRDNKRVNEYNGVGTFIRSFGWDVVASGPDNTGTEYEICEEEEGDLCKAGVGGATGTNEHKTITFNNLGPSFSAGDTFKLGNLPGSCSESETETIEFVQNAGQMVSRIIEAWEAKCAGGVTGFSGPFNPQFDFGGPWAETDLPELTCTTISGSGVCGEWTPHTDGHPGSSGTGQFGEGTTSEAWGIAVSPPDGEASSGTVFVADTTDTRINTYALDGSSPGSIGSAAVFSSNQPRSIAVDSRGIVYATNNPEFIERYDSENANGEGVGFLEHLTEREQESQTVSFLSFNGGDQFTLTCPSGEPTPPITWQTNNTVLGQNMVAALQAKCGGDYFTIGPNDERTVIFVGSFEGTNVPQMTCTVVGGNGSCEVTAESDGVPGALLPGTGQATEGMAVDPDLDAGGPEEDILYILRDPAGNGNGTTRVEQIGPVNDPGLTAAPTDDDTQHAGAFGFNNTIGFGFDPVAGSLYVSSTDNPPGPLPGGSRVYIVSDPPVEPVAEINSITEIGKKSAKVNATINLKTSPTVPNPPASTARLEFKLTSDSQWTEYGPEIDIPAEDVNTNTSVVLGGLVPNSEYDVRYTLTGEFGSVTSGAPVTFLTLPAAPQIEGFFATNVQATTADLVAVINPLNQAAKYRFEYGPTPEYGSVAPVPDGEIAASPNPQKVVTSLEGLQGVPYHFRLVTENETGATTSADQTFTFYPPDCPNSQLRQQTSSAYLPDCRAYELVSPPRAESTILTYEGPVSPTASNPSRFGFTGLLGLLPGTGEPLGIFGDVYISTRTSTGWVTKYVGIRGNEGAVVGGPPNYGGEIGSAGPNGNFTNNDMSKLIDWDNGQKGYVCCGAKGSFAGFMWGSDNNDFLGRVPTNIEEIESEGIKDVTEGGFEGAARPSQDFSHYFFSSNNIPFTEDGQPAGEGIAGSLYDNDLETGTVILASRTPSGEHLPIDSGPADEYVNFPHPNAGSKEGISTDGSHVMMATEAPGNLTHLYMRVDGATTYDVSIGQDGLNHPAEYEGMTPDGETVYITSTEKLTLDDEDESQDIFMWTEKPTPTLTRISKGAGEIGNEDGCGSEWIAGCGAEVVDFRTQSGEFSGEVGFVTDNSIAANNGDVYFYSPELLDEGQGTYGQRNLYDLREGAPQYVATFFDENLAERIQVSPNDDHAAFLTAQKLTTYDNEGFLEMYHYSAPTGEILCVSCKPDGSPPKADIEASQNGLFMSDDGRTFFSTPDKLVEKDVNGLWDTYEFVENRAQLISTGTADRDQGRIAHAGLQGVSADGVDVYFSTLDTMVGQDLNGPFYKFYNARTNGGFPFAPEQAGCAAADECHGPDSEPPLAAPAGTGVALGSGGNVKFNPCAGYAKRAKQLSSRAKSLRRRAKKSSGKGARRMTRRSRNFAKRARKMSRKAKRCRSRRAKSSSRGAGR